MVVREFFRNALSVKSGTCTLDLGSPSVVALAMQQPATLIALMQEQDCDVCVITWADIDPETGAPTRCSVTRTLEELRFARSARYGPEAQEYLAIRKRRQ